MYKEYSIEVAGRTLTVETGKMAQFANGSALIRYGDTAVLTTATASKQPRPGIEFFPLTVDYEEKMYSVGRFPGGFIRREGRPSENAVLTARAIDRPMRPLFPADLRNDVVISNLVMSVDHENSPEFCAMLGSALTVTVSDIPFNGPIASVMVGIVDGEIIINPSEEEMARSDLDLIVAGSKDKITMIEAGANEVPDEKMMETIEAAHAVIGELCDFISEVRDEIGKDKFEYESFEVPQEVQAVVHSIAYDKLREAMLSPDKALRDTQVSAVNSEVREQIAASYGDWMPYVGDAFEEIQKQIVREYLFEDGKRVDGRGTDDIRDLSAEVGLIPRSHGSALFQRGQTQVLANCTLQPLSKTQTLDGIGLATEKRYLHHYNFPAYSVGEARGNRSAGRREIGHGALAERSLLAVLPTEEEFPYAIRNVSDILMSNGSTSQGAVCASTLALMDAGVPIKRPVAGISAGLITNADDDNDYLVFMDIQGIEDFYGDMDFKVAGTTEGITSIQVDIKVQGLTLDIIRDAFAMTKKGRLEIINDVILPCLAEPREDLSPYAPKILQTVIPSDRIGEVVGKGGKTINQIIADTGAQIDIDDDGHVYVSAPDIDDARRAITIIEGIVTDPEPGQIYEGRVTRLMNFGAFVEYLPSKEGLVHISKMAWGHVENVEDVVSEGDIVQVKVLEIDAQGRINLSIRDVEEAPEGFQESRQQGGPRRGGGSNDRGDRRDRGGRSDRSDRGDRRDRSSQSRSGGYDRDRNRGPRNEQDRGGQTRSDNQGENRSDQRREGGGEARPRQAGGRRSESRDGNE